jgi:hypothetical protein
VPPNFITIMAKRFLPGIISFFVIPPSPALAELKREKCAPWRLAVQPGARGRSAAANELQFIRLEDALDLVVRVH